LIPKRDGPESKPLMRKPFGGVVMDHISQTEISPLEKLEAVLLGYGGSLELREKGYHDGPLEGIRLTVRPHGIVVKVTGHGSYTCEQLDAVQWLNRIGRY
jgi:hypothetical protein